MIYTDDHGYSDLSCQGIFEDVATPNIDALATGGARMTDGYCTAPQCAPSRAGLISGVYQNRFGMEANGAYSEGDVLDRFRTMQNLPKRLKQAGYVTGMAGKSHLGSNDSGDIARLGFDKVLIKRSKTPGHWNMNLQGEDISPQERKGGGYHLELVTDFACTFIDRFKDKPFFFYAAYRAPHVPLDPPPKYLKRFPGKMPERRRKALAMLSAVDDGVGKMMQLLRRHQLEEDTLIFVISDNGAPLKLHKLDAPTGPGWDGSLNDPLNGEKGMLTEGGIRVPFAVYWKGRIPNGQVYSLPVITLDVAATAVAVAGLPRDPELDGVNLIPFLDGSQKAAPHESLFWRWNDQSAMRKGTWKYVRLNEREYLFDLSSDIGESKNLAALHPNVAQEMLEELEQWSTELTPPGIVNRAKPAKRTAGAKYFDWYLDGIRDETKPATDAAKTPLKKKRRYQKRGAG
ncbi:sulfatase family protein [Novipirellula artificiosorum]|uniref:sulfatase family protein n=1 Tax=Novipirellula artificiosorum TaxID=2528016 RepID=UPI001E2FDF9F|nr:sulfatase-like hydrolase/transferase [Novipirellula artificiosorum]